MLIAFIMQSFQKLLSASLFSISPLPYMGNPMQMQSLGNAASMFATYMLHYVTDKFLTGSLCYDFLVS